MQREWEEAHREETERKKREEREGRVDTLAPYLPLLQVCHSPSSSPVGLPGRKVRWRMGRSGSLRVWCVQHTHTLLYDQGLNVYDH